MKIKEQHREHLPAWLIEDIEDPEEGNPEDYAKVSGCRGAVRIVDSCGDVQFAYRGRTFYECEDTTKGFYGRWRTGGGTRGFWAETMTELMGKIDRRIEEKRAAKKGAI